MADFDTIPISDIPTATRGTSAATIALGSALLVMLGDSDQAVLDRETYPDRKTAQKRANTLKRAAAIVDATRHLAARIYAADGGYRVAILAVPTPPKASKSK